MKKLTFVTSCMGRLEHLKQTLPLRQHPDCENIIVDWSCPDNCGDWVEEHYPSVKVIRVPNQQYFHPSKARNIGFEAATSEYVCKTDADLLVSPPFFDILPNLRPDSYYVQIPYPIFLGSGNVKWHFQSNTERAKYSNVDIDEMVSWTNPDGTVQEDQCSLTGVSIFPRSVLNKLGSYHDTIYQSGGEDFDFRCQLLFDGELAEVVMSPGLLASIPHSDDIRIENQELVDFFKSRVQGSNMLDQKWGKKWKSLAKQLIIERSVK